MRWTPGGRSDDIEDDRDQSGGGGGGFNFAENLRRPTFLPMSWDITYRN